MVIENYSGVNPEAFVGLAIAKRLDKDVAARCRREDWEPADDGRSDEVRLIAFVNAIPAAVRESGEAQLRRQALRSQVQLGNEAAGRCKN